MSDAQGNDATTRSMPESPQAHAESAIVPTASLGDRATSSGVRLVSTRAAELTEAIEIARLEADQVLALQKLQAVKTPASPAVSGWLPAGMGVFGMMLGGLCGLSNQQGISGALLAGVSSFVGGVLLTYSGFKRVATGAREADIDAKRVGQALFFFAIGVLIAATCAAAWRFRVNAQGEMAAHGRAIDDAAREHQQYVDDVARARQWALEDAKAAREAAREDAMLKVTLPSPVPSVMPNLAVAPVKGAPSQSSEKSSVTAFGLQSDKGRDRCLTVGEHLRAGAYSTPGFAESDAWDLFEVLCPARNPRVCNSLKGEMDSQKKLYTGKQPVEAVSALHGLCKE